MNKIIKIASNKGLKEVEVFYKDTISQEVKFENNNLKSINSFQNSGTGLRGIYDNKMGMCSFTHDFECQTAVDKLVESSKYSEPKEFEFAQPNSYTFPKTYDNTVEDVSLDKLVSDGEKIIEKVKQYDKEIMTSISFGSDIEHTKLSNSLGMTGEYKKSTFIAYLSGKVIDGTNFIETDCYKYGIDSEYNINQLVYTFIERMKYTRQESTFESRKTNILFTPKAFVDILTTVSQGVNGNSIEKGISPLCNRIGETIFDERFSLLDDPTLDNNAGSQPFDDEGFASGKNYIIQNGMLKSYVHSLKTAAKTNSSPTGNGNRSSYDTPPSPGFNNMVIMPGTVSFEEMLDCMGTGIIIDEIIGLSMNNLLNGDFGGSIHLGYKVENGKIMGRVKNMAFNSNIYKILKDNLISLSDLNYTHTIINSTFTAKKQPCALFKDINVTVK